MGSIKLPVEDNRKINYTKLKTCLKSGEIGGIYMISAMVVDDEQLTMEYTCRLLKETGRAEVIGGYINPVLAMEEILRLKPDVVFLDIEMPELDGLQIAQRIYESDQQIETVFITAYNEYALEAFRVNAIDYLLKPISYNELSRAVERVKKRRDSGIEPVSKTPKVKVAALGGFSIWIEEYKDKMQLRWYTKKCKELMAYFVLEGTLTEVSKWKLIELLWNDKDSEKGDINLRSTLCRLNKTLREAGSEMRVISKRNSYILKGDNISVDALELQKLALDQKPIDRNSLFRYEAAVSSYKGTLLEGYEYSWSEELRVTYQRCFVILCRKLAEYYLEQQRDTVLVQNILDMWLRYEPYDEEAHSMALKLHFIKGGEAAKQRYFNKLCGLLDKELGIKPSDKLIELHKNLK